MSQVVDDKKKAFFLSGIGDVVWTLAIYSYLEKYCSDWTCAQIAIALTVLQSSHAQLWYAKKTGYLVVGETTEKKATHMEIRLGALYKHHRSKAIQMLHGILVGALKDVDLLGLTDAYTLVSQPEKWQYQQNGVEKTEWDKRWIATHSKFHGYGATHGSARFDAVFNFFFKD